MIAIAFSECPSRGQVVQSCATNAVIGVSDGTVTQTVTVATQANDSGPIAQNYSAGKPLTVGVVTPSTGFSTNPANANVVMQ
jgi:hypothetical protein